jgi:hypothetical protein
VKSLWSGRGLAYALVIYKVCEIGSRAIIKCNYELRVKWSINPIYNPNPVYNHSVLHDNVIFSPTHRFFQLVSSFFWRPIQIQINVTSVPTICPTYHILLYLIPLIMFGVMYNL